ncbi:hypothetical protein niasHS_018008 [Heterodera schachtii]|uniref:Ubiquitin-like domain-containing protein n=1 Tax=Heterodera schachtii TaxID=97005 RepID=A0ABD2HSW9_HETSC
MRAINASKDEHTMIIVDLNRESTVAALKQAIKKVTGIPRKHQLIRNRSSFGEVLEDQETLEFCLRKPKVFLSFGELKIRVNYGSETFIIMLDKSDTVATLKKAITEMFGIPHEKQVLIDTRDLVFENDGKTMDDYGVKKDQNVILAWNEFEISVKYDEIEEPISDQVRNVG